MGRLRNIAIVGAGQAVVREAVVAALGQFGWWSFMIAAIGSFGVSLGAWFEDKTILDIIVYGLATFAAVLFLTWFVIAVIYQMRGIPMTLATEDEIDRAVRMIVEVVSRLRTSLASV